MQDILTDVSLIDLRVIHAQETETLALLMRKANAYDQIGKHELAAHLREKAAGPIAIIRRASELVDAMTKANDLATKGDGSSFASAASNADSMPCEITAPPVVECVKDPNPWSPPTTHVDLAITVIADGHDTAESIAQSVREGVKQAFRELEASHAKDGRKTTSVPLETSAPSAVVATAIDAQCECDRECPCHDGGCDCPDCCEEEDDDEPTAEDLAMIEHEACSTIFAHVFLQTMAQARSDNPAAESTKQATAAVEALLEAGAIFAAADQINAKL
jgi:hypothetical protein